jgi:integrase
MEKREREKTQFPGVRFRTHPERRHGIQKDRYFFIRYRLNGRDVEEGAGWLSEGMSAKKAASLLAELRENQRRGEGPRTLREKRELSEARHAEEENARRVAEVENVTFSDIFTKHYWPVQEANKKQGSLVAEKALFTKWVCPVIGQKPLTQISQFDLERIRSDMSRAGLKDRSIHYALCVVRQVFRFALERGLTQTPSPTDKARDLIRRVKKTDNTRERFFTYAEEAALLAELQRTSPETRDIVILSIDCGLRFGEVAGLMWADVDLDNGTISLRDTKSGKPRAAFMTARVKEMFLRRGPGGNGDLVFPANDWKKAPDGEEGKKKKQSVSHAFNRAVNRLGLNNGLEDSRQRLVYHSCRHTFASRLAQAGIDLYSIQRLMGHQSFDMVQRYAHLAPDGLRAAVSVLERPEEPLEDLVEAQDAAPAPARGTVARLRKRA